MSPSVLRGLASDGEDVTGGEVCGCVWPARSIAPLDTGEASRLMSSIGLFAASLQSEPCLRGEHRGAGIALEAQTDREPRTCCIGYWLVAVNASRWLMSYQTQPQGFLDWASFLSLDFALSSVPLLLSTISWGMLAWGELYSRTATATRCHDRDSLLASLRRGNGSPHQKRAPATRACHDASPRTTRCCGSVVKVIH